MAKKSSSKKPATKKQSMEITALNVKTKQVEPMDKVVAIYKTLTTKGNWRYRVSGKAADGTGMNRFVNAEDAMNISKNLGMDVEEKEAAPPKKRKSCAAKAKELEEKCEAKKKPKAAKKSSKKSSKKAAAKKPKKSSKRKSVYSGSDLESDSD